MCVSLRWWFCLSAAVLVIIPTLSSVQCANILAIFPHHGVSHWLFFRPIVTELVRRDHNVTLLSYYGINDFELRSKSNYNEHLFKNLSSLTNTRDLQKLRNQRYMDLLGGSKYIIAWGMEACDLILNDRRVNEILKGGDKFDLLLTESFQTDCAMALAYKLGNIPVVGLSSCALLPIFYERLGVPDHPSYIPSFLLGFSEKMSLKERIVNYVLTRSQQFMHRIHHSNPENKMLRQKFGPDFPDIRLLARNISLVLVNQHYAISGSRPSPPNVLDLAGVHVIGMNDQMLDRDLQSLLDRSTRGVIVMSFGSVVRMSSLPADKWNMLMKVFGELDQNVIMKWENDTSNVVNKPRNVHLMNWLPQKEILSHPNVKLLFSHGGMMGLVEAMINKVPVLGTPMSGDQYLNVAAVDNRKAGLRLNFADWTEESLRDAIQKCLSKEYQDNAAMIAFYLSQRDPLDLGVNAIENVIATKGFRFARPYSTQMSWFAVNLIDVYLILISPIVILIGLVFLIKKGRSAKVKRD